MVWVQDTETLLQGFQTVSSVTSAGILATIWYRIQHVEENVREVARELKEHIIDELKGIRKNQVEGQEQANQNALIQHG